MDHLLQKRHKLLQHRPSRPTQNHISRHAHALRQIQNSIAHSQTDAVALNAALALRVGDRVLDLSEGVSVARDIILSGAGWSMLEKLVAFLK